MFMNPPASFYKMGLPHTWVEFKKKKKSHGAENPVKSMKPKLMLQKIQLDIYAPLNHRWRTAQGYVNYVKEHGQTKFED